MIRKSTPCISGSPKARTERLSEEVALNIGAGEKLIGIEVLDAKQTLGTGEVAAKAIEGLASARVPQAIREKAGTPYRRPARKRIADK